MRATMVEEMPSQPMVEIGRGGLHWADMDEPAYPPHCQGSWWPGDVVIGELAGCSWMIHLSFSRGSGHFPESLILVDSF